MKGGGGDVNNEEEEYEAITANWSVWMFLGLALVLFECAVGSAKKWIHSRQKKEKFL